ncbi:putative potassium transporter 15 [Zea mays]|uniref:Potassium transporter n=1 Tax=Zea mays TaxID=4577 RepID=A0A1D6ICL1_MAIZE|nr:putative potassium transporter 15 [Zea mays]|eukprot:XP_020395905.1 uncharacterized protein LOC100193955 isoform X1 [Zea mays]
MKAESGGVVRRSLQKTESAEMRWVVPGGANEDVEIESSDDGSVDTSATASGSRGGGCSDEDEGYENDEMLRQLLVRTGPRADSFDVEALDVPGVYRHQEFTLGSSIVLTLQTLGVVFGDVGTSPLYTFDVMFNKYSITAKEDVLGALSLVIYTLILIPFLKYTLIVLWGNDGGEGGTFALYSLICRNAKASLLPNQLPSDTRIANFNLKVPSVELERSLKIKERLETSSMLKKLLLMLVLFGTSMVIADGVVTSAMSGSCLSDALFIVYLLFTYLGDLHIFFPSNKILQKLRLSINNPILFLILKSAVMSAVNGLKVGIASVNEGEVVMITVAFLIVLFSLQRFGTSKVGLAVGPALFVWFCCLAGIGMYNLRVYGPEVLQAFNPVYIYYYFERNPTEAWMSLGGCLLCATGSEAMFADLCYFSVKSVQLTFVFLVLPCLLLGYLGQAAFLMENLDKSQQVFFLSIPSQAFWPVVFIATLAALIASRAMTTAIFSTIKQATALGCFPRLKIIHTSRKFMGQIYIPVMNWFLLVSCLAFVAVFGSINEIGNAYGIAELGVMMMTTVLVTIIMLLIWQVNIVIVLCFLNLFLGLELFFFSSVLGSAADGSWVLLVFAAVLYLVMYIWNYGTKLKYETEVKQKLSMDLLIQLGCNLGTVRAPGIGLLYNELVRGVPAIFGHFLTTLPAMHSMIIFVCIKWVPVPVVPQNERFLFRRVCPKNYHMFRCIARYGYKDVRKENHQAFEQLLIESLEKFIRREAQERSLERSLESDHNDDKDSEEEIASSSSRVIDESGGADNSALGSSMSLEEGSSMDNELSFIHKAKESGVVYLLGHGDIRARKESFFVKKLVINYFYAFLRRNCRRGIATLSIPHTRLMQVGMQYMV